MSHAVLHTALEILAIGAALMAGAVLAVVAVALAKDGPRTLVDYRTEPPELADLLPWVALVAPGTVLTKQGSFLTAFAYRGPDLDSATPEELVGMRARLNNLLRRYGSGWYFYIDMHRRPSTAYPTSNFPDPITEIIDAERRQAFENGEHFESTYTFTLGWLPPGAREASVRRWFFKQDDDQPRDSALAREALETFRTESTRLLTQIAGILPDVQALGDADLVTYLHSTASSKHHPVQVPGAGFTLDHALADQPLIGGSPPRIGDAYIGALTVKAFPSFSQPGLLDRLNRLDASYRWTTRWIALDKLEAESQIASIRRVWFSGRKGLFTLLKEMMFGSESRLENTDAINKAEDANAALEELSGDHASYGYFTQSVIVLERDQRRLEQLLQIFEKAINELGFVAVNETRDGNALDAWLGAIPGNCLHNVRRPLLSSLNLVDMMPVSAVWPGPRYCPSDLYPPNSPPHLYASTSGSTPFRLSTFVGDVGHTLMVGPTGAGKSVHLNVLEAQFRRYPGAQVVIFDKGGSSRVLTLGVAGTFYDLGAHDSPSFQPLARIDQPSERAWAHEWILDILAAEGMAVTPERKAALWVALNTLATTPRDERTLTGLSITVQDPAVKTALRPYTNDGPHGHLLDASDDDLELGDWITFEMEELMHTKAAVVPVLTYLFHRLEERFAGRPSLLVLDEAWLFLDHPVFAEKIREWLKVLRKANVAVVFATQSLADVGASKILPTVLEACQTKIYLPNYNATSEESAALYRRFGLNRRQIQILAMATPRQDYYLTSPVGNRLYSLGLGPFAQTYCAATSKEAQALALALRQQAGGDPAAFNQALIEARSAQGVPIGWALDFLRGREQAAA